MPKAVVFMPSMKLNFLFLLNLNNMQVDCLQFPYKKFRFQTLNWPHYSKTPRVWSNNQICGIVGRVINLTSEIPYFDFEKQLETIDNLLTLVKIKQGKKIQLYKWNKDNNALGTETGSVQLGQRREQCNRDKWGHCNMFCICLILTKCKQIVYSSTFPFKWPTC